MSVEAVTGDLGIFPYARDVTDLGVPLELLEKLPVAMYACDADGCVVWFNQRAVEIWGRTPRIGEDWDTFCGLRRLSFNEQQVSRQETPMATVRRTGMPARGVECKVDRPDG